MKGTLYIIATPIGNLEDITIRALSILKEKTDYVFCEDTRVSRKLLSHYNINLPAISFHSYSSAKKIDQAISYLEQNKSIAYLTDSGTPGISDPGAELVRAARYKGMPVIPIPGPSALTSITSVSGFPSKNIIFLGFLSKKDSKKIKELEKFKNFKGLLVMYESPYRIKKLLAAIYQVFPESEIIIGREITKMYEEFITGKIEEIIKDIDSLKAIGEFTVAAYVK
ncbi:MAG: 16S rRNA (cytidine(1402)-2'-O)-methyltransferase [Spirochaetes bacterium]|nr:16S rRNA (cytidine(1402)-2'-O)-methyltransferase [Spirochaetota bacterium]